MRQVQTFENATLRKVRLLGGRTSANNWLADLQVIGMTSSWAFSVVCIIDRLRSWHCRMPVDGFMSQCWNLLTLDIPVGISFFYAICVPTYSYFLVVISTQSKPFSNVLFYCYIYVVNPAQGLILWNCFWLYGK